MALKPVVGAIKRSAAKDARCSEDAHATYDYRNPSCIYTSAHRYGCSGCVRRRGGPNTGKLVQAGIVIVGTDRIAVDSDRNADGRRGERDYGDQLKQILPRG